MTGAAQEQTFRDAQKAIAHGSQSFAAAAKLMPKGIREDTVLLYAWCRHADDVVDGQVLGDPPQTVTDPAARLARLKTDTLAALHDDGPATAPFAALRSVARRHDFPASWPMDLIAGFEMDVAGQRYHTLSDTLTYSYHVAGVVGIMMARVMGVQDDRALDHACDLGLAFQLTNIARDVMDDAAIGRCYLPQDWLDAAGAEVTGTLPSPALYSVILRLLDTAEPYYASAMAGLSALPLRCAWSIAAAAQIYRAIGTRIRQGGPEAYRMRIGTSSLTKTGLAVQALGHAARSRMVTPPPSRAGLWSRDGR